MNKIISIPMIHIKRAAYVLISLPLLTFICGWLKWYWILPVLAVCALAFYNGCIKKTNLPDTTLDITRLSLILICLILLIWIWLSGTGGFWGQSEDYPYRNALYRDLILREWPVIYEKTGHAMVYYFGFWLFPALFGKLALWFSGDDIIAFNAGCVSIFVWTFVLLFITILLIIKYLHAFTKGRQIFAVLLFVFFSGMDIIPRVGMVKIIGYHIEWWTHHFQYTSMTTDLFWVFNQAVPAWLCTIMLMNEKKLSSYVFIGMICLFCAPFPFVEVFLFALVLGIERTINLIRSKHTKELLSEIFSLTNICSAIVIFPIIASFLLSNAAIQGEGSMRFSQGGLITENDMIKSGKLVKETTDDVESEFTPEQANAINNSNILAAIIISLCVETIVILLLLFNRFKRRIPYYLIMLAVLVLMVSQFNNFKVFLSGPENMYSTYFSFICIEFFLYMLLIFFKYRKEPLYYTTLVTLMITPFIRIGYSTDFCMRSSIPGLMVVYLFTARFIIEEKQVLKQKHTLNRFCYILLSVFLCIGAVTPSLEFFRNSLQVYEYGIRAEKNDWVYTLGCDGPNDSPDTFITYGNFVCTNPSECAFFQLFCRRNS